MTTSIFFCTCLVLVTIKTMSRRSPFIHRLHCLCHTTESDAQEVRTLFIIASVYKKVSLPWQGWACLKIETQISLEYTRGLSQEASSVSWSS